MKTTSTLTSSDQKRLRWISIRLLSVTLAGILLIASTPATAHTTKTDTVEFHRIDQPTTTKVGVAAIGFGLIALELWWFLGNKTKA